MEVPVSAACAAVATAISRVIQIAIEVAALDRVREPNGGESINMGRM
jgi:hypothetical protein